MSKSIKLISVLLLAVMLVMTLSNNVFAAVKADTVLTNVEEKLDDDNTQVNGTTKMSGLAGRIINFLQYAAIIGGTIILAVLGIKYMMGSVEEKAEYKKSFIPLIVGVVVVMGAISIANVIFQTFTV